MSEQYLQLHSDTTSLVVKLTPAVEILYWGKAISPIGDQEYQALCIATDRGVGQARLDEDIPVTVCPEFGRGSYGSPGIEGHRQGSDWAPVFGYVSHTQTQDQAEIVLEDKVAGLRLNAEFSLHQTSGVLNHQLTLTNLGDSPYQLKNLALTMPLPHRAQEMLALHGRWSREFQPLRHTLSHGGFHQENRRGRTSAEYFPGCLLGTPGFGDQSGEVWSFHLGWSGNHHWRADVKSDGRRLVQFAELLSMGEVELAGGESYQTPKLHCAYSPQGLNGVRHANHDYVRETLIRFDRNKPRPVHLNTWEGIYFEHDPAYICRMASEAAEIGVERFIIDDGWFKGRNDDTTSLGDWVLDTDKYPHGLKPVVDHVNRLGMEFGIWVEPEMVNTDSDLYRAHPEWLLDTDGYHIPTGRNQHALNLQITECFDYLYQHLDALLSEYNIGYVKWDMNRELTHASHQGRAAVHGQTEAVYRLFDKITKAHPQVEFESCSSGGARIDYKVLEYTCRFWTSDCNDALERQTMQRYMSLFFPPELMGAHIGPKHSHTTRRVHDIHWRGLTALTGHMGVELDPVKESSQEKQQFAHYIALHKRYRHLLHSGRSFYLDNHDERRHTYGVQTDDEALVVIAQLAMPDHALAEPLRPDWLDDDAEYRVTLVDYPRSSGGLMKRHPQWGTDGEVVVKGQYLKQFGLSVPVLDPEAAMLVHFERM